MKVELVRYTDNPHEAIELAASNCYDSTPNGKIMNACYQSGHHSVLEFAQFHFHIEGISRACSHQLVRHRTSSFAQKSQRYVSCYGKGFPELPTGDIKSHKGQRFFDNQEQFLANLYCQEGYSTNDLSKIYGGDSSTIFHIINKYTQTRTISETKGINKNYFEVIDNTTKAYILGMLYSDGCLSIKKNGLKQIILDQLANEELLLLNIIREIKPNGNVTKSGHNSMVRISIQDNDLCTDLEDYGIVPHKGICVNFNQINEQVPSMYIKDVIRGIFEGDGHISVKYNTNGEINDARFSIAGTLDTCESIQKYLIENLKLSQTKISHITNKCYQLTYGGRQQVIKIIEWLYDNVNFNFIHTRKAETIFKLCPIIKQKYIKEIRKIVEQKYSAIIPYSIAKNIKATNKYILALENIKSCYQDLQRLFAIDGILGEKANEDIRFILPNACCTSIDVSMDFRNLCHFMNERLCTRAQWEIREVANQMRKCVIEVFPEAQKMLVPKCETHNIPYCPEYKGCGKHKPLKEIVKEEYR